MFRRVWVSFSELLPKMSLGHSLLQSRVDSWFIFCSLFSQSLKIWFFFKSHSHLLSQQVWPIPSMLNHMTLSKTHPQSAQSLQNSLNILPVVIPALLNVEDGCGELVVPQALQDGLHRCLRRAEGGIGGCFSVLRCLFSCNWSCCCSQFIL